MLAREVMRLRSGLMGEEFLIPAGFHSAAVNERAGYILLHTSAPKNNNNNKNEILVELQKSPESLCQVSRRVTTDLD